MAVRPRAGIPSVGHFARNPYNPSRVCHAVIALIPAVVVADQIAAAQLQLDGADREWRRCVDMMVDDRIEAAIRAGRLTMRNAGWIGGIRGAERAAAIRAHDKLRDAERRLRDAAACKPRPPRVVIQVMHAYEQRQELKARGYRYDPHGRWLDWLGAQVMPAWTLMVEIDGEADLDQIAVELDWLQERAEVDDLDSLRAAIFGYRLDLR